MRMAACAGKAPAPSALPARSAARHCKRLGKAIAGYRARWMNKATPFFAKLVPKDIPRKVIYPFGGGDLLTALVVFPELEELTTVSLEPAGDLDAPGKLSRGQLVRALASLRTEMEWLLLKNYGRTKRMRVVMTWARLPGQMAFSVLALAIHGYAIESVRYFRFLETGAIEYLSAAQIERGGKRAFANAEIRFRRGTSGPIKVFRHVQQNLDDSGLRTASGKRLLAHLASQGPVTAMTKAASYLLWWRKFGRLRRYLTEHMRWMISDSTGLLPRDARPKGFVQQTWGRFNGCFIRIAKYYSNEQARLWRRNPYRRMPFRFGYPDNSGNNHLMITRRRKR